ncbi:MAG: zinc ribbon domain-containing protein [Acidobacteria bacterium]|nr:zinc ribbon domain-containing protein [Acidobacteriota bacterium]
MAMFCPKCGSTQDDGLRFCKACGANLGAVKQALATPERDEGFAWKNTWVADMLMSSEQAVKRKAELDRLKGITPDSKRRNEIKAGTITASVGLGLMIFLYIFMQGVILGGGAPGPEAEIIKRLWVVGVIPLLVGVALIANGLYVSKLFGGAAKPTEEIEPQSQPRSTAELPNNDPEYLGPANTTRFAATPFSVTDETTRHLQERKEADEQAQHRTLPDH